MFKLTKRAVTIEKPIVYKKGILNNNKSLHDVLKGIKSFGLHCSIFIYKL